jgi:hypothetical protein
MNINDKEKVTFRRLLLSKELYLHGLGHSNSSSSLDKMIAIHNFHNALEICLRAILLSYEIRIEKHLNIDFESMLNEIDSFDQFKNNNIKLPYRQEIRNLNQLRNMVQHHAMEPESSTMDDWKVFTRRFLIKVFKTYFDLSFDKVSSAQFIEEEGLKGLILLSYELQKRNNLLQAMISAKLAFIYTLFSVRKFMPDDGFNNDFFAVSNIESALRELPQRIASKTEEAIRKIYQKIDESKLYSIIISSGVSFVDYKNFERLTPHIDLTLDGSYIVQIDKNHNSDTETVSWVINFVEQIIIKWQLNGMDLKLSERVKASCSNALEEINSHLK